MSYMRGKYYIWVGTDDKGQDDIFLWISNDPDNPKSRLMENSIWADEMKQTTIPLGTWMPLEKFDELVAMRYAEMVAEGIAKAAELRAVKLYGGNGGCDALSKKYGKPTMLDYVTMQTNNVRKKYKVDKKIPLDEQGHDEQCNSGINQPCDCWRNPEIRKKAKAEMKRRKEVKK